jgi:hypothetical protein
MIGTLPSEYFVIGHGFELNTTISAGAPASFFGGIYIGTYCNFMKLCILPTEGDCGLL